MRLNARPCAILRNRSSTRGCSITSGGRRRNLCVAHFPARLPTQGQTNAAALRVAGPAGRWVRTRGAIARTLRFGPGGGGRLRRRTGLAGWPRRNHRRAHPLGIGIGLRITDNASGETPAGDLVAGELDAPDAKEQRPDKRVQSARFSLPAKTSRGRPIARVPGSTRRRSARRPAARSSRPSASPDRSAAAWSRGRRSGN